MYNDEENLYHYSYQKDSGQQGTSGSSVEIGRASCRERV